MVLYGSINYYINFHNYPMSTNEQARVSHNFCSYEYRWINKKKLGKHFIEFINSSKVDYYQWSNYNTKLLWYLYKNIVSMTEKKNLLMPKSNRYYFDITQFVLEKISLINVINIFIRNYISSVNNESFSLCLIN